MIWHYGLKDTLLKALNLHKDRRGLVKVRREVNKPGVQAFFQYFWVRPNRVKPTDKVIAGHRNLPDGHPKKAMLFLPAIKQQTNSYFQQFSSVKEAYSALKLMGITWHESNSPGVNLIRAKTALNTALHNGFILPDNLGASTKTDLVQLPVDATLRQQNLAALINNMTDIDVIKKCSLIGMVPEDKTAEGFIVDFLLEKLVDSSSLLPFRVSDQISSEVKILDLSLSRAFSSQKKVPYLQLLTEGVYDSDKDTQLTISNKLESILNFPILDVLYDPQKYLDNQREGVFDVKILGVLNKQYGENTDDPRNDGFVKVLQQIKQNNPHDFEVSQKVDDMIETYLQLNQAVLNLDKGAKERVSRISTLKQSVEYHQRNLQPIPPDSNMAQVYQLLHKLFGKSVTIQLSNARNWKGESLSDIVVGEPVPFDRADKVIFSNLILLTRFVDVMDSGAKLPSKFEFDVNNYSPSSRSTQSQLKSLLMYSSEDVAKVTDFVSGTSSRVKDVVYGASQYKNLNEFLEFVENTPREDVIYKNLAALLSFVSDAPKVERDNLLQPLIALQKTDMTTKMNLQQARQYLFQSAKLSLATESHEVSDKMRADILNDRFDYKPGETDQSGHVYDHPIYDGSVDYQRFALFNSRFFKINNSIWEERITNKINQLQSTHPDHPEYYEVKQGFHGTSYWSAINILGRDGEFAINPEETEIETKNGTALGNGIYLADKLGKSLPYVGDDSYSMLSLDIDEDIDEDSANGIALLVNYVRGDHIVGLPGQKIQDQNRDNATCVLGSPANCSFKAAEIMITDNTQVCPQYLVDVSGRILSDFDDEEDDDYEDYEIPYHLSRDRDGNFINRDGTIIYTADHKNVSML